MKRLYIEFEKMKRAQDENSKNKKILEELELTFCKDLLENIAKHSDNMDYFQALYSGKDIYTMKDVKDLPEGWEVVGSVKDRGFSFKDIDIVVPLGTDKIEAVKIAKCLFKERIFELRYKNTTKPFYDAYDNQWIENNR